MVNMDTLYFRDDNHIVNGLTACKLISTQGASGASVGHDLGSGTAKHYWGIRVWIRHSDGSEDELTNSPVAMVNREITGSGIQSNTWDCPETTIVSTDAIRIRVYGRFEGFSWFELACGIYYGWIGTQIRSLGDETTLTGTWTVYYWTDFQFPVGADTKTWFKWGDAIWNSRISGMERIEVYGGGPYVSFGTLDTYDPDNDGEKNTLTPINLPYERVSENLQKIIERMVTSEFAPWEWWFTNTGQLRVADTRGTDKSGAVNVQAGNEIGGSIKETSSKQTAQRIRVVGRGESEDQDEVTSEWQSDEDEMLNVNSFYEKIISERSISNTGILDVVNNLTEADIWANVLLSQYSPLREEVTVRLENNPYIVNSSSGDFDVGDTITVTDPATGLSGSYRIKTITKSVTSPPKGETLTLTCTNTRKDITDRIADIQRQINMLMNSSTFLDRYFGEGGKQRKIKADEVEDIWEQTSSNKWSTELPEDESDDVSLSFCDWAGFGTLSFQCDKEYFEVTSDAVNAGGDVFLYEPLLKFSRDPRFTCEFTIFTETEDCDEWQNSDAAYIDIWKRDTLCGGADPTNPDKYCCVPYGQKGFGFQIININGRYELRARLWDSSGMRSVQIANVNIDTKYIIEARMEWKEKVVKYYFGKADVDEDDPTWGFRLRGILPVALDADDEDELMPFHVAIYAQSGVTKPAILLYRWKTQAIRAVEA